MESHRFTIVIPVRYDSTRFPGKPLSLINGKTMLQHVVDRCRESKAVDIIVTTDDARIQHHAHSLGVQTVMTEKACRSGSERIAMALNQIKHSSSDIIVNVQGDEPLISAENINQIAKQLANTDAEVASLYQSITALSDLSNPNVVKVITDEEGRAMCFSRAEIPYSQNRDALAQYIAQGYYKKHIGMYAYKASFLHQWNKLTKNILEEIESLEQLSWLTQGIHIQMAEAKSRVAMDVNTQDDLERICQIWDEHAVV